MARKARDETRDDGPPIASLLDTQLRVVDIDSIAPHPENGRRGNVPAIKTSIMSLGFFYGRVLVWEQTGQIVVGSHRWKAAKELGMRKIPAEFAKLTEEQARQILATDNRTSDLAGYDDAAQLALLRRLADDGNLLAVNYSDDDITKLMAKVAPPMAPPAFENLDPGGMHLARKCPKCGFEF
jgi:hypothetical protein